MRKSWFAETGTEGLIALSGAHLRRRRAGAARRQRAQAAERSRAAGPTLFPDRFYIELQRAGPARDDERAACTARACALAARARACRSVATHPIQFVRPDDFRAHEARVCISEGYVLADQRRPKSFHREQYFKTQAEMAELFADMPRGARERGRDRAALQPASSTLGKSQLPRFPTPDGESTRRVPARARRAKGSSARLEALYPDAAQRAEDAAALPRAPRVRDRRPSCRWASPATS